MKTWVLLLLGCMLVTTSHAQSRRVVYQWRDANGVTHFSDYPQPGARQIVLNGAPTSTSSQPATTPGTSAETRERNRPVQYTALEITSPDDDATFFGPDAQIVVQVRSEPELDQGDRMVTYFNGRPLGEANEFSHSLSNVERGTHTLQSAIFGSDGAEKIRSRTVTFHMQQAAIANPRNQGPAVRPPPRPKPR